MHKKSQANASNNTDLMSLTQQNPVRILSMNTKFLVVLVDIRNIHKGILICKKFRSGHVAIEIVVLSLSPIFAFFLWIMFQLCPQKVIIILACRLSVAVAFPWKLGQLLLRRGLSQKPGWFQTAVKPPRLSKNKLQNPASSARRWKIWCWPAMFPKLGFL